MEKQRKIYNKFSINEKYLSVFIPHELTIP